MAAVELATAYVSLSVDSSQIGKEIGKGFAGGDKVATRSGRAMGASMRKAFSASKPLDVGSATKKLEDAQDRLAMHTEKSASKQKKAQESVEAARQKVADTATKSSEKVTTAQSKVEQAEESLARTTEQSARDQESAKRKVELAQAKYNDTVSKYGAESTQALGAANKLADAEDRLAKVTTDGAAKQERAKAKAAAAQDAYAQAVKESGEDSEAARKAADDLSVAEQQLEAAALDAASGHEKLASEVTEAKSALDQAQRSTKGLRGAWGKAKDFGADYKGMGDRLNKAIGPKIWSGVKWGALGAAGAVTGVLGGALVKGWGRLSAIENAEAKLTGLGHSAESVETIMGDALTAVKGTAFGLDEAAGLAGTLVASGIEPGKELERTLALTADSATIAGRELGDMGLIWGSVAAKGKLQGDDAQQLLASGVPIWQMVGDVMGKTAAEAQELGSKGKVSFDVFRDAMENGVGGAAQDAGNTTQGAFKNMGAALGRFGAAILKDIYPAIGPLFGKVTELFDYLTDAAGPAMEGVIETLKPFASGLKGVWDILAGGDFTGNLFGFEEDSAFVDFLFTIREAAIGLYDNALKPLGAWFADNWKPIAAALGGLAAFFGGSMLVSAIAGLLAPVTTFVSAVGGIVPAIGAVVAAVNWWMIAAAALAAFLGYFFTQTETGKGIVVAAWAAIQRVVAGVSDFFTNTVWPALLTGWDILKAVATEVWDGAIKPIFEAIASLAVQVWNGVVIPAFNQFVGYLRDTVMPIVQQLWTDYIQPTFLAIGGLAVWLWNNAIKPAVTLITAFWTNVLGPVIVWLWKSVVLPAFSAIGSIIAGVVTGVIFPILDGLGWLLTDVIAPAAIWLWKNAIVPAFNGIVSAVKVAIDWITGTAWPALQTAWTAIADAAVWLWKNIMVPAWDGIQAAIKVVGDWITGTLAPALQAAWGAIASAATWLYQNIILPVWDGIRIAIAIAVTAVLVYIDLLKWYFTNVIAPAATWLYQSVIKPVWGGIKTAIGAVVTWMVNTAWPMLKSAWDAIAGAAQWLYRSVILPVWNGIKTAIGAVVSFVTTIVQGWVLFFQNVVAPAFRWLYQNVILPVWNAIKTAINAVIVWFRDTAWPVLRSVIDSIKAAFNVMRDALKAAWNFVKNNVIQPVIAWFRDTAWPAISRVIDSIKDGFNAMRDSLKAAWNFIKDNVIAPVVDWITGTVKTKLTDFTDLVGTAFDTLKDGVLAAWDAIQDGMKSPINGVIGIYNKHIAGNFNDVIETIFGKDGGEKYKLSEMTPFATGGYTGPGSKYQEAGIVHADEYVIRKESQNDLRRRAPGLLDSLNRHGAKALGYAGGGLVKLRQPFAGSYPRGEGFGARGGAHKGIDYPMPSGAVLKAVGAGTVSHTWNPAAGKKLELSLGNGLVAGYHHLSSYIAGRGDSVGRGADVARVGSTGRSSGPHLHFSLKRDGKYVDPAPYLGGGGDAGDGSGGSWWNPFDGLWDSIKDKVSSAVGEGTMGGMLSGVVENTIGGIGGWVTSKISEVGDWAGGQLAEVGSALSTGRWTNVARNALGMTGDMSMSNLDSLMRRMNQESGGNAKAINDWDSNAKRGTPSKGLMQVIQPTFDAYKYPGHGDIWAPLDNILASIRYTKATYGSLQKGWNRKGGYADGGLVTPFLHDNGGVLNPGVSVVANKTQRPEAILTDQQWSTMHSLAGQNLAGQGGSPIYIENAGLSPKDVADEIEKKKRQRESLRVRVLT